MRDRERKKKKKSKKRMQERWKESYDQSGFTGFQRQKRQCKGERKRQKRSKKEQDRRTSNKEHWFVLVGSERLTFFCRQEEKKDGQVVFIVGKRKLDFGMTKSLFGGKILVHMVGALCIVSAR